jgi:hypothetical protein
MGKKTKEAPPAAAASTTPERRYGLPKHVCRACLGLGAFDVMELQQDGSVRTSSARCEPCGGTGKLQ